MIIKFKLSFLSVGINSGRGQVFRATGGVRNRRRGKMAKMWSEPFRLDNDNLRISLSFLGTGMAIHGTSRT